LENFCADKAIDMWMEECPTSRRPHRNPYRPCKKSSLEATDDSENEKLQINGKHGFVRNE